MTKYEQDKQYDSNDVDKTKQGTQKRKNTNPTHEQKMRSGALDIINPKISGDFLIFYTLYLYLYQGHLKGT